MTEPRKERSVLSYGVGGLKACALGATPATPSVFFLILNFLFVIMTSITRNGLETERCGAVNGAETERRWIGLVSRTEHNWNKDDCITTQTSII